MAALELGLSEGTRSEAGVHNIGLADDEAVLDQLANVIAFQTCELTVAHNVFHSRLLAEATSAVSLGSIQILPLPHLRTLAARRFWSLRKTMLLKNKHSYHTYNNAESHSTSWHARIPPSSCQ